MRRFVLRRWDLLTAFAMFAAIYGYAIAAVTGSSLACVSFLPAAALLGVARPPAPEEGP